MLYFTLTQDAEVKGVCFPEGSTLIMDGERGTLQHETVMVSCDISHDILHKLLKMGVIEPIPALPAHPPVPKPSMLDRICTAVAQDPALEYALWQRMKALRYRGSTWEEDPPGEYHIPDINGEPVAHIVPVNVEWGWWIGDGLRNRLRAVGEGLPDTSNKEVGTEVAIEAAKEKAEAALAQEGWRVIPDPNWRDPRTQPDVLPVVTLLSDWFVERAMAVRLDEYGRPFVIVNYLPSEAVWFWRIGRFGEADIAKGTTRTIEDAQYRADKELTLRGWVNPSRAEPDPSIPF